MLKVVNSGVQLREQLQKGIYMRLNLWMITNRLYGFEIEYHIPEEAPINLLSARLAISPNCLYVYQKDSDVICDAGTNGGYIIFHNDSCLQIFNLIQSVFDDFNKWAEDLNQYCKDLDYKLLLKNSWRFFHNPLVLLNGSNSVLFMSKQYGRDDVNDDWRYLYDHGHSSIKIINYMMSSGRTHDYYMDQNANLYHFENTSIGTDMISTVFYNQDNVFGRLNIIQKDRTFNSADLYLANYINNKLAYILSSIDKKQETQESLKPYFVKMLLGLDVTPQEVQYWKNCIGWKKNNPYRIITMLFQKNPSMTSKESILVRNYIQNMIPQTLTVSIENQIIFCVSNEQLKKIYTTDIISYLRRWYFSQAGISLPFYDTSNIKYYYQQSLFAASRNSWHPNSESINAHELLNPEHPLSKSDTSQKNIADFYYLAVQYLITNKIDDSFKFSCHPDILAFYQSSYENPEIIKTYFCYLENNGSIAQTARALYIHKNTLRYRIQKIEETFLNNDKRPYTISYMYLSLYILLLLDKGRIN